MTGDDPHQSAIALSIADAGYILTSTVLLETEWVLRSRFGWSVEERATGFRLIVDSPGALSVPANIGWAIDRLEEGCDFADVIHIISATGASTFATFDRNIAKKVGATTPLPIETLA